MKGFWNKINEQEKLDAVLIECAFPNGLKDLAKVSHHLTPNSLRKEMKKLEKKCPVYVINLKPMYRDEIIEELNDLQIENLNILEVGKIYEW